MGTQVYAGHITVEQWNRSGALIKKKKKKRNGHYFKFVQKIEHL
jgi:hypothetical protein